MSHEHFRLDWLREAKKLEPYFDGMPGVVRIDFESEDAADDKFNHFVKEQFQNGNSNGQRASLRLDDEWSTTFPGYDQVVAVGRKLEEHGVAVDWARGQSATGDTASGNQAGRDNIISIENSSIINGVDASPMGIQRLLHIVCEAMKTFVEGGGHFMLIVNDMARQNQGKVWKSIWMAGLRDAGGDQISLVYFVGPKCGAQPHSDAPVPEVRFKLPHEIETDESRQDEVYDDVFGILTKCGYSSEEAAGAAKMLVDSNSHSVRRLHMGLATTLMNLSVHRGATKS